MSKIAHNAKEVFRMVTWLAVMTFGMFLGAFIIGAAVIVVLIFLIVAI